MICVKARLMAFAQKHSVTSFRFEFVANSFIIDPMCSHEKHIFCIAECCCLVATEMLFPVWKLDAPTNLSFFSWIRYILHFTESKLERKGNKNELINFIVHDDTPQMYVWYACDYLMCCLLNFMKFSCINMGPLSHFVQNRIENTKNRAKISKCKQTNKLGTRASGNILACDCEYIVNQPSTIYVFSCCSQG